jgi:hypothetical protein
MYHADSLSVFKKAGHLLLNGRVHFITIPSNSGPRELSWNKDIDLVQCDGGFVFTLPMVLSRHAAVITKRKPKSRQPLRRIAKDSAGTYAFFGQYLVYDKKKEFLVLPEKPLLHQYEKRKNKSIDTVAVKARYITYDKKNEFAQAFEKW